MANRVHCATKIINLKVNSVGPFYIYLKKIIKERNNNKCNGILTEFHFLVGWLVGWFVVNAQSTRLRSIYLTALFLGRISPLRV